MALVAAVVVVIPAFGGCSDQKDDAGSGATTTTAARRGSGAGAGPANTVSIDMKDYAFAVSGPITAGTTTVAMRNSGTELHMASFDLLRAGKTLADVQAALASGDADAFESVVATQLGAPGSLLSPGRLEMVTTDLLVAGRYAVICFLPTAGGGGAHFTRGMVASLDVAAGDIEGRVPEATARYTVDDGSIEGPRRLHAGTTTLRVTAAGKGPHEVLVVKKRRPATTISDIDSFFTGVLDGRNAPPKGYADDAPGIVFANSFDVASGHTVSLTTDLEPGDYLVGCSRAPDGAGAGRHTGEIVEVTVT